MGWRHSAFPSTTLSCEMTQGLVNKDHVAWDLRTSSDAEMCPVITAVISISEENKVFYSIPDETCRNLSQIQHSLRERRENLL